MTALAPDPDILVRRTRAMIQAERITAARPLLAALQRVAPELPESAECEARLLRHDGDLSAAHRVVSEALAAAPDALSLRLLRAELRLEIGELLGAADDAAAAVMGAPASAPAKALLGVILIQLERHEEAVACLLEAVAAVPAHVRFRLAFAHALECLNRPGDALTTLIDGVALVPGSVELRVAAIVNAMRWSGPAEAESLAEAARRDGLADARVFEQLGHALAARGRHEAAARAFDDAIKLAPEDPRLRYLAAASRLPAAAGRPPVAELANVFDLYAGCDENRAIRGVDRIPGLLRAALLEHVPSLRTGAPIGPALDLGCGAGLMGVALSDLKLTGLVGVDASARMISLARARGVYASFRREDISTTLGGRESAPTKAAIETPVGSERWAMIVAADSLCYFGAFDAVMAGLFTALRPGGLCVFSLEDMGDPPRDGLDWTPGPLGRCAHRAESVRALATDVGFQVRALRREPLRFDRDCGREISGLIVVLARPL